MTRGLRDEAAMTIREMARVNKKPIPVDLEKRLGDHLVKMLTNIQTLNLNITEQLIFDSDDMILLMKKEESMNLGYIGLFSSKGLIFKTFNVTIALVK